MSEADPRNSDPGLDPDELEEDDESSSPFDHPAFLPVLLVGFTVWFGYDGWFNPEIEAVRFNKYGFGVALAFAVYYIVLGIRESQGHLQNRWLGVGLWGAMSLWFAVMVLGIGGGWYVADDLSTFNLSGLGVSVLLTAVLALRARGGGGSEEEA